jgi:hypothetical protein
MGLRLVCLLLAAGSVSATCDTHNDKCRTCLSAAAGYTGCACEYNLVTGTCKSTTGLFGCESGSDGFTQDDNSCPECTEDADCLEASYGPRATCVHYSCLRAEPEPDSTDTVVAQSGTGCTSTTVVTVIVACMGVLGVIAGLVCWRAELPQTTQVDESVEATSPITTGDDSSTQQQAMRLLPTQVPDWSQAKKHADAIGLAVFAVIVLIMCIGSCQLAGHRVAAVGLMCFGCALAGYGYKFWYYTVFASGFVIGAVWGYIGSVIEYHEKNIVEDLEGLFEDGEFELCTAECQMYAIGGGIFVGVLMGAIFLVM